MANKTGFGIGVALGAAIGAVAALFMSPDTGKKNREKAFDMAVKFKKLVDDGKLEDVVKNIYGDTTDEAKAHFEKTREVVMRKVDDLKEAFETMDKAKFETLVNSAIEEAKTQKEYAATTATKVREYFVKQWEKAEVRQALKPDVKLPKKTSKS